MRPVLLTLGGRAVSSYQALLAVGICLGLWAGAAVAEAEGAGATRFTVAALVLLGPALVGARLLFLLQHRRRWRTGQVPTWERAGGGASLYGGLVAAVALSPAVLAAAGLGFWEFWDCAAITMLVGTVPTRVGCLLHGCCAGRPTRSGLGMRLPGADGTWARRVPTPLLEATLAIALLVAALALRPGVEPGTLFLAVVAGYGAGRLALEATREPDPLADWPRSGRALAAATTLVAVAAAGIA